MVPESPTGRIAARAGGRKKWLSQGSVSLQWFLVDQASGPGDRGIDSDALLAAYQLLLETTIESGGEDVMLHRALVVLASIRWPAQHRSFAALLPAGDGGFLRLVASVGAPSPPCNDAKAAACLCGRALVLGAPALLRCDGGAGAAVQPRAGLHVILPLSRGPVMGCARAAAPDRARGKGADFLVQVASLLG
jgi:hypothetical protein